MTENSVPSTVAAPAGPPVPAPAGSPSAPPSWPVLAAAAVAGSVAAATLSAGRLDRDLRAEPDAWRAFNLGRAQARRILRDRPLRHPFCGG